MVCIDGSGNLASNSQLAAITLSVVRGTFTGSTGYNGTNSWTVNIILMIYGKCVLKHTRVS